MNSPVFLADVDKAIIFPFVAIKENVISYSVQYSTIELLRSVMLPTEYKSTTGLRRSFTLGMPSSLYDKPIKDVYADFHNLCVPGNGKSTPPVLILQWFSEIFSPCIIDGTVDFKITRSVADVVTNAEISFSLLQIPEDSLV